MTERVPNLVLSGVLMLLGAVWTWLVVDTIPPGFGDGEIGARAFPLAFGIILMALSALLLLRSLATGSDGSARSRINDRDIPPTTIHWGAALLLLAEISLYGVLLEKIGFVLATPVIVLLVMVLNLRQRAPGRVLGMALGLTLGCWLVFEKVLGIYLANGTWANIG